jgi:hypothetical protein
VGVPTELAELKEKIGSPQEHAVGADFDQLHTFSHNKGRLALLPVEQVEVEEPEFLVQWVALESLLQNAELPIKGS